MDREQINFDMVLGNLESVTGSSPTTMDTDSMDIDSSPSTTPDIEVTSNNAPPPPPSFTLFHKLPKHIRLLIWTFALPAPRTRFVEMYAYSSDTFMPQKIRYIPPLPTLFSTTRESRKASVAHEGGELTHFLPPPFSLQRSKTAPQTGGLFYFNFSLDILFLSSRFRDPANENRTLETYRLQEFASALPAHYVARLRRVLVTYSALDSYEKIGPVLRAYAGLETLYVGMLDLWSSKAVARVLRRGKPAVGCVAGRIRRVVEETEAEETEDEEESEEEVKKRMEVRARRRIVEVEARPDEGVLTE